MVALEVWKLSLPKNHWFPRRSSSFEAEPAASTAATEEGPSAGPPWYEPSHFSMSSLPQKKLATPAKTCVIDTFHPIFFGDLQWFWVQVMTNFRNLSKTTFTALRHCFECSLRSLWQNAWTKTPCAARISFFWNWPSIDPYSQDVQSIHQSQPTTLNLNQSQPLCRSTAREQCGRNSSASRFKFP